MKIIILTKGFYSIIDDEYFDKVDKYRWSVCNESLKKPYAKTRIGKGGFLLPYLIIDCPIGCVIDHINGNSLDNRKSNLRIATKRQNHHHQASWKGVCPKGVQPVRGRFNARIFCDGINYYLGIFNTQKEASDAYDAKASELFGEFAYLNRNKHLYVNPMTFHNPCFDKRNGYKKELFSKFNAGEVTGKWGKVNESELCKKLNIGRRKLKSIILKFNLVKNYKYIGENKGYYTISEVKKDFNLFSDSHLWKLVNSNEWVVKRV